MVSAQGAQLELISVYLGGILFDVVIDYQQYSQRGLQTKLIHAVRQYSS